MGYVREVKLPVTVGLRGGMDERMYTAEKLRALLRQYQDELVHCQSGQRITALVNLIADIAKRLEDLEEWMRGR